MHFVAVANFPFSGRTAGCHWVMGLGMQSHDHGTVAACKASGQCRKRERRRAKKSVTFPIWTFHNVREPGLCTYV